MKWLKLSRTPTPVESLLLNGAVLPGLGTLLEGIWFGWVEISLSVIGGVWTLVALVPLFKSIIELRSAPQSFEEYRPALIGLGIFVVGWGISCCGSLIRIWRKAKRDPSRMTK